MIGLEYLQKIWLTLSTPRYYLQVIRETLASSLVFLLISCLWLGSLNALFFTQHILPTWQTTGNQLIEQFIAHYPPMLQISWDLNRLSWQPTERFALPFPNELRTEPSIWPATLALLVSEDQSPTELGLNQTETIAVVTPSTLYLSDQKNWNQLPLGELPGFEEAFVINQARLPELGATWQSYLTQALNLFWWISFGLAPLLLIITSFWNAFLNAVLVFFILRMGSLYLKFQTTLKLSAHVVVASLFVTQLQQWLYPNSTLPLASFAYWIYMTVIIFVLRRQAQLNQLQQTIGQK